MLEQQILLFEEILRIGVRELWASVIDHNDY
jgi:hypothetical protein